MRISRRPAKASTGHVVSQKTNNPKAKKTKTSEGKKKGAGDGAKAYAELCGKLPGQKGYITLAEYNRQLEEKKKSGSQLNQTFEKYNNISETDKAALSQSLFSPGSLMGIPPHQHQRMGAPAGNSTTP